MKIVEVTKREEGGRLDKFLLKYLTQAGSSFIYKMLRKKNITLNGRKAAGSEILVSGDTVTLFFSEETLLKFTENGTGTMKNISLDTFPEIIFENSHIMLLNKPAGMLSQKAKPEDITLTEQLTAWLLQSGEIKEEELLTFRPGVCNRLDRNTSGIIIAGKTLFGLQTMSAMLSERTLHKYYLTIVKGTLTQKQRIEGYLSKNHAHNKVEIRKEAVPEADHIVTEYEPLLNNGEYTLLKVNLITGKSHQIRAHLSYIGHPVIGDGKYGDKRVNEYFRKFCGLNHHLLHAFELVMPDGMPQGLSELSGRTITAAKPDYFEKIERRLFAGIELGKALK